MAYPYYDEGGGGSTVKAVLTPISIVVIIVVIIIMMSILDMFSTNVNFMKHYLTSRLGITFPSFGDPYLIATMALSAVASAIFLYIVFKIGSAIREGGEE